MEWNFGDINCIGHDDVLFFGLLYCWHFNIDADISVVVVTDLAGRRWHLENATLSIHNPQENPTLIGNPLLRDIELQHEHIFLILDRKHRMRTLIPLVKIAHQINFLGIGHPFPDNHKIRCREREPVIFTAVVDATVEGILFGEVIAVVVDFFAGSLDTL